MILALAGHDGDDDATPLLPVVELPLAAHGRRYTLLVYPHRGYWPWVLADARGRYAGCGGVTARRVYVAEGDARVAAAVGRALAAWRAGAGA